MEYLDTLVAWLQSRQFQILLLGLFFIGCAAMALNHVHTGPYTRQQKDVAILVALVVMLVVGSAVLGLVFG